MSADRRPLPPAGHAAFTYAAGLGWPAFPVKAGDKRPLARLVPHGFKDATTDVAQLVAWWTDAPRANVGVRTGVSSGLVVIDVDGDEGRATLAELEGRHGALPPTLTVDTPSGGEHRYFKHPGGKVSSRPVGAKVDVKGDGGCVNAPPSTVNGRPYVWRQDPWRHRDELADLPAAWVELLADKPRRSAGAFNVPPVGKMLRRGYVEAAVRGELEAVATAGEGERNARLFKAAARIGSFVAAGQVAEAAAADELTRAAEASGLRASEARAAIASGFRAASRAA